MRTKYAAKSTRAVTLTYYASELIVLVTIDLGRYLISFSTSPATTWPDISEGGTPGPGTVSWPVK